MTFDEVLTQVLTLRRQGRVSYRALKRRFDLDDEYIEDLKAEIIQAQRLAVDEDGAVLVWTERRRLHNQYQTYRARHWLTRPNTSPKKFSPHVRPWRRAQTGHRAVCRHQGLHGHARRPRP